MFLKIMWIDGQRLAERRYRLFIFLVFEIGVSQVAVQHRHIAADIDGLLIGANRLVVLLALIPNRSDIVLRVGVERIGFYGAFVILERERQSFLLVHGDAQ